MDMAEFKAGQHVICRFDGKRNGDVVVGRIESVRNAGDGHVIIRDSITNKTRTKSVCVFESRNVVVPKALHDMILREPEASRRTLAARTAKEYLRFAAPPYDWRRGVTVSVTTPDGESMLWEGPLSEDGAAKLQQVILSR